MLTECNATFGSRHSFVACEKFATCIIFAATMTMTQSCPLPHSGSEYQQKIITSQRTVIRHFDVTLCFAVDRRIQKKKKQQKQTHSRLFLHTFITHKVCPQRPSDMYATFFHFSISLSLSLTCVHYSFMLWLERQADKEQQKLQKAVRGNTAQEIR